MSTSEVAGILGKPSHDRLYRKADGQEAIYEPRLEDGSRSIAAGMRCTFGSDERLRVCTLDVGPFHTQYVDRKILDRIKVGQGIVETLALLCTPGSLDLTPSGGIEALYFIRSGGQFGAQSARVAFDKRGRFVEVRLGH